MKSLARMLTLVRPYPMRLLWLLLIGLLNGAFHMGFVYVIKLVATILNNREIPAWMPGQSISIALGIATMAIGGSLLLGKCTTGYAKRYLRSWLSRRVVIDTQQNVASHLLTLDMGFFQQQHSGELVSRLTNDMRMLSRTVSMLGVIITEPFALIFGIIWIFYINWELASLSFIALPIGGIIVAHLSRKMRKAAKRAYEHLADATTAMVQFMAGIRTVKSFRREADEESRFRRILQNLFNVGMKGVRARARVRPLVEILAGTGAMLVLFIGGRWVLMGKINAEDLWAFYGALGLMYQPAKALSNANSEAQESLPAAERVFEIFDTIPEILDTANAVVMQPFKNEITIKDLTFSYIDHNPVLKDINFSIPHGESLAIVGPSGAGKSTLVDLVARFHDPQKGSISIDGQDIREIKLHSLLEQIAIVSQDPFLFFDTIKVNIAYGKPQASQQEIEEAARAASIHEEILALPAGYNTRVGERGDLLSGGQRQRICIARAVLKNAPILILDEATSSLDTENETLVQKALEHLMQNRTSLIIAHRLSTIRHADRVIVLENGRLIATGTHEELICQDGIYAMLWAMQCGEKPVSTITACKRNF